MASLPDYSKTKQMFHTLPLDAFLEATATKEPVPGGGGIAAMTAASAAALVEMVANLTVGKKGYEEVGPIMLGIRDRAGQLRQRYLRGIDDDANAFAQVIQAVRLPKDTPHRTELVQQAFKDAATIPFALGKDIFTILQLAEQTVRYGNAWVITDGAIAAMNARAAMRSAFYSVRINLKSITDSEFTKSMMASILEIEAKAALVEAQVENEYAHR
ncbi:MAG: cyclodeaminase/cyclohydrolase family protein [Megasphaera sp.]|jgi:formiminotetrahydrofolate cyclodeaminase|nr:cyclodeaminase/cyclohydrolase family protein [Megasphaera sp.]MCH4187555.1 cyclodeaminase/cyclohydrolase family protein [Megasphaera sp.]MCH4217900.1 cyclodeaminase/cyclohydrolase family protein [Megasphaera sp.]